jgi:hypothetical protein
MRDREVTTYPGERTIYERLDAFVALHVVAEPYLDDLVLRNGGSDNIEDVGQGRQTNTLEILA